ncbi:MAG TPA: hypothetical protein VFJ15_00265 [Oleiagrimonas sp.]|nr:hypothetical protein [Oleiagrimonas sp.]
MSIVRGKERGQQKSTGLQKRLRGPYSRRFLAHGTTMGRQIAKKSVLTHPLFRLDSFYRPRSWRFIPDMAMGNVGKRKSFHFEIIRP